MGIKLGDVSPLVGMVTGEGMFGKAMRDGFGGVMSSAIARDAYAEKEAKKNGVMPSTAGMKKGGTASSRADGCAQRGKTKGRMV